MTRLIESIHWQQGWC